MCWGGGGGSVAIVRIGICISDIVIWAGIVYCARKQVVDIGPGSPSDLVLSSWGDCRLYGWWPLAVAGGVREFDVCSSGVRTCFVYVINAPCHSVEIYECIPGIYVITRVIRI